MGKVHPVDSIHSASVSTVVSGNLSVLPLGACGNHAQHTKARSNKGAKLIFCSAVEAAKPNHSGSAHPQSTNGKLLYAGGMQAKWQGFGTSSASMG